MSVEAYLTLFAILAGPLAAVAVQIFSDRKRRKEDQQLKTFRQLVSTRHLPGDPGYSTAINMIPVDFNDCERVREAHRKYIDSIQYQPTPENFIQHQSEVMKLQTKLIFAMAKELKLDIPETEIQSTAYAAGGFTARDNMMVTGWLAWPRIADALEQQNEWLAKQNPED